MNKPILYPPMLLPCFRLNIGLVQQEPFRSVQFHSVHTQFEYYPERVCLDAADQQVQLGRLFLTSATER